VFRLDWWGIQWVIMALQTITPKHQDLRQITIWLSYYLTLCGVGTEARWTVGVAKYRQWLDLDRLLVRLWESHSIRPKVVVPTKRADQTKNMRGGIGSLLPEITKRGIIDFVEYHYGSQEV
jgi:hypothetical protein